MNHTSIVIGALFAALAVSACAANAHTVRLAEINIVNRDTGERLTPYHHGGRVYVAGTPGQRYSIELKNRDRGRLLSVLSVDGVNVLTGESAAPAQSGYVLSPWQQYAITGWRKSADEVAQFVFTALPDSYAARTGRPDNVGVIGIALFREKAAPAPVELSQAPASAPAHESMADSRAAEERQEQHGAKRKMRADRLGTGHGAREVSRTSWTDFERASAAPDELVTIYYDSRQNLIARGVIRVPHNPKPNPFPAFGFVPDPRG
ncbi:MAG TPA: hypothetical protein VIS73_03065 [Rhodocyclaceae bacterium]